MYFSVIEINSSTRFELELSVNDVTISPNNSSTRAAYKCKKCKQIKRGHNCPFKNLNVTIDDVLEEPLGGSRAASNRENLSWFAQRVDDDESSGKINYL